MTLEQNYRSTRPILDATNAVIALSPQRHDKTLWSAREGARTPELVHVPRRGRPVRRRVPPRCCEHRERGVALKQQAVLFRAGHHSDLLEVELARRNIPFVKYGGLKFLESAHVKDVLACSGCWRTRSTRSRGSACSSCLTASARPRPGG